MNNETRKLLERARAWRKPRWGGNATQELILDLAAAIRGSDLGLPNLVRAKAHRLARTWDPLERANDAYGWATHAESERVKAVNAHRIALALNAKLELNLEGARSRIALLTRERDAAILEMERASFDTREDRLRFMGDIAELLRPTPGAAK